MKLFTLTFFILVLFFGTSNAEEYRIDLSPEGFKKFDKRGFGKKTIFESGKDEKGYFIKATADSSATGIGLKIEDREILNKYPYINFNIQVLKDFSKNTLQKEKTGHDFVCRLMTGVGKKIGSKVVSLSHSSWLEEGYSQNSPWSSGAKDIIVSSDNSGKPIQIKVNVLEILEQHHPSLKGNINFLALFTDSNNSKEKVECLYRDIFFSK